MRFFGHRPGSLRETIAISLPLMLSSLSIYLMYFFERCVLAWFSLDALNAAVQASSLCWAFWGGMTIVAGIAEIFISRYNGQGHCKNIGSIVWQTLWLSLAAGLLFMAIGIFATHCFYPSNSPEASYFRWSMTFGVLNLIVYALTTFFVGRGKVKWMLALTMATCLLNLGLDFALIFGIDPWIPSSKHSSACCLPQKKQSRTFWNGRMAHASFSNGQHRQNFRFSCHPL
jgi:MATE family multidrug resistance protein